MFALSRTRSASLRFWIFLAGVGIVVTFPLGMLRSDPSDPQLTAPKKKRADDSVLQPQQPAKNPSVLTLLPDAHKVVGWISGTANRVGAVAHVRYDGNIEEVKVEQGNLFIWNHQLQKNTQVEFSIGDLKQSIGIQIPAGKPPSVFFLVDRTTYRPNQKLQFSAILRAFNAQGEFVPVPMARVEVLLTAQQKKTEVAKMVCASDKNGQIAGGYTFRETDPLDTYHLTIPNYLGSAEVLLAEYRKDSARIEVSGEIEGKSLKLQFKSLDYLDRPVPGQKVDFTTQVVARSKPKNEPLNSAEFAYANKDKKQIAQFEDLGEDDRLMALAYGTPSTSSAPRSILWQDRKEVKLNDQTEGDYTLEIPEKYRQGRYALLVCAILLDGNGRELRTVKSFPLDGTSPELKLALSKTVFTVDEAIEVRAEIPDLKRNNGPISLVALKLIALPRPGYVPGMPGQFGGGLIGISGMGGYPPGTFYGFGMSPWPSGRPYPSSQNSLPQQFENVPERKFITAEVFQDRVATLRLSEPGAYKLLAVLHTADGKKIQQEIGCVVKEKDELPKLTLQLEKENYQSGEELRGKIRSRFSDALVLLTVRDSTGYLSWTPIRLKNGSAEFQQKFPKGIRYGASVEVQYTDKATTEAAHFAGKTIHVLPTDRIVTIATKHKEVYQPGDKVTIDIDVNRKEEVDLVVSVFDKSLLTIAPDKSVDIRNFYLADDRAHENSFHEYLRRRLGGITVQQIAIRAQSLAAKLPKNSEEGRDLKDFLLRYNIRTFYPHDFAIALRLAGIPVQFIDSLDPTQIESTRVGSWMNSTSLVELLEVKRQNWAIVGIVYGDTVLLASYHPVHNPHPFTTNPWWITTPNGQLVPRYPYYGMTGWGLNGGGGMMGGMGMMGGGMGGMMGMPGGFGGFNGFQPVVPLPVPPDQVVQALAVPQVIAPNEAWVRRHFLDSAYWSSQLRTDANGKASAEFKLPDSLTNWQVVVTAVSKDLHVGKHQSVFRSSKSIMVDPILPRYFVEGDVVDVFANIDNGTDQKHLVKVKLDVENVKILGESEREITLEPNSRGRVTWKVQAGKRGTAQLLLSADGKVVKDATLKKLPVLSATAEQEVTWSGGPKQAANLTLPNGIEPKEATLEVSFAPSLAADMVDTLDYLLEYPYGCVEQTMSRFLPAIKVAQILQLKKIEVPTLKEKLPAVVAQGIHRLLELQLPDGGWGWQQGGQTHEMMTPYALYGLLESEKAGYTIKNSVAIKKGLDRLRIFIDNMTNAQSMDRIFCMYVYGMRYDLEPAWWKFITDELEQNRLSDQAMALALELAVKKVQTKLADRLAAQLRARAINNGDQATWKTAGFSRWGDDRFEITAAVMKALVAYDANDPLIRKALAFFAATKRGNRWNSTKDTAMIIFAMSEYLQRQRDLGNDGKQFAFRCNGGERIEVAFGEQAKLQKIKVPAKDLKADNNHLEFLDAPGDLLIRAVLRFHQPVADVGPLNHGLNVVRTIYEVDEHGKVGRTLKSGDKVAKGAYLVSDVRLQLDALPTRRYLVVEAPVPTGFEVIPLGDSRFANFNTANVFREEREGKTVFHHEEAAVNCRDLSVWHVEMSGELHVPPARAELMYNTEMTGHSGGFTLRVE